MGAGCAVTKHEPKSKICELSLTPGLRALPVNWKSYLGPLTIVSIILKFFISCSEIGA